MYQLDMCAHGKMVFRPARRQRDRRKIFVAYMFQVFKKNENIV